MLLVAALLVTACSKSKEPEKTVKNLPAAPQADGPDKAFKPFPKDDPRVVKHENGLMTLDLEEGKGKAVDGIVIVKTNYTGWLPTTGKVFDANWKHSPEPSEFPLAKGQVIDGFSLGFQGMKEGGRRLMWLPSALAYKDSEAGSIPPNSDLMFEVALFEVKEAPQGIKDAAAAMAAQEAADNAKKDGEAPKDK
jgi:FKBP-type peptidyl-prolyl cis-trans isomerase